MTDAASTHATESWSPPPPAARLASDARATDAQATRTPGAELTPGTMLPRTRVQIRGRLGEGGWGVVYLGLHVDLQRMLAIKVDNDARDHARERFLHEARAASRIDSPHVVEVVDFGELPDGRPWYAMAYVGGRSLAQLLSAEGALAPARVVALLRMACRGLAATHAAGLVHRDVKPGNLVVRRRGAREELVIVDFGLAAHMGRRVDGVAGTPEYMAPEQVEAGIVDARTDVYALGCCAFEMLTGRSATREIAIPSILDEHVTGLRPQWPDSVPAPLRKVVERCLASDPDDRFVDMHVLGAALERAAIESGIERRLSLRETLPRTSILPERSTRRRSGTRRIGWLAAALVGSVLVYADGEPKSPGDSAEIAAASGEEGVLDPLALSMLEHERLSLEPRSPHIPLVAPEPPFEETPTSPGRRRTSRPKAPAEVTPVVAEPQPAPEAEDPEPEAPAARPVRRRSVHALVRRGRRALARGDHEAAEVAFVSALEPPPARASVLAGLADVYLESGRAEEALSFARLAVKRAPRWPPHRVRLGDVLHRLARTDDARREYEHAIRLGSIVARVRLRRLES